MTIEEWEKVKVGDKVKEFLGHKKGVVIGCMGIGKLVEWNDGTRERVQANFSIDLIKRKGER